MQLVLKASTYQRLYDFYGPGFIADGLPLPNGSIVIDLPLDIVRSISLFGISAGLADTDQIIETMIGLQAVNDRGIRA